jgi:dCTP deaminase
MFKEIAQSFLHSQLEEIKKVRNNATSSVIKGLCDFYDELTKSYFEDVTDWNNFLEFRNIVSIISTILKELKSTSKKEAYWIKPLIIECYNKLGIPIEGREILIIESDFAEEYGVMIDFIGQLHNMFSMDDVSDSPIIDIFYIPSESKFDVSSTAIIGHEAGHVLFNMRSKEISGFLNDTVNKELEQKLNEEKLLPTTKDIFYSKLLEDHNTIVLSHIEEYICDEIGRSIFGPSFDFTFLKLLISDSDKGDFKESHPPTILRLKKCFESLNSYTSNNQSLKNALQNITDRFLSRINDKQSYGFIYKLSPSYPSNKLHAILVETSISIYPKLIPFLKIEPFFITAEMGSVWNKICLELDSMRPPIEYEEEERIEYINPVYSQIFSTIYYYGEHFTINNQFYNKTESLSTEIKRATLRHKLADLNRYSTKLYEIALSKAADKNIVSEGLKETLWNYRKRGKEGDPFIIVPNIDPPKQYGTNAVDLRLGFSFITQRLTEYTHIPSFSEMGEKYTDLSYFYESHERSYEEIFTLHPHSFVLAATLEYVCVPSDYYALVLGRSSWGRLGLTIATATAVGPGFRGCITLELRNLGETPLKLKVGTRICQICLIKNPTEIIGRSYFASSGKYICPIEAEIPKIIMDND